MRAVLLLSVLLAALVGCDDAFNYNRGGHSGDVPPGWCATLQLFEDRCVGCHSATTASGGLDLATDPAAALIDAPSTGSEGRVLVVPGDADASYLVIKLEGAQTATEGGQMPPGPPLDEATLAALRAWIDEGADTTCDTTIAPGDGIHPEGYASSVVHGPDAKLAVLRCPDCHGADLGGVGAAPSCDACHPEGWRTDCVFCHGDRETDNGGAPPRGIDGEEVASRLSFPAHTRHVETNNHAAYPCETCHTTPTSVLSAGHLWDGTAGQAEVNLRGGLSDAGRWDGASCSNMYCHGNGRGDNGRINASEHDLACDRCHGSLAGGEAQWDRLSGRHDDHMADAGLTCVNCHRQTTADSRSILDPARHVNGVVDFVPESGATVVKTGNTCNGTCHGEVHDRRDWN